MEHEQPKSSVGFVRRLCDRLPEEAARAAEGTFQRYLEIVGRIAARIDRERELAESEERSLGDSTKTSDDSTL